METETVISLKRHGLSVREADGLRRRHVIDREIDQRALERPEKQERPGSAEGDGNQEDHRTSVAVHTHADWQIGIILTSSRS